VLTQSFSTLNNEKLEKRVGLLMNKSRMVLLVAILFILIFAADAKALTPDYVISNSEDWRDVYSSILYANLIKADSGFLVSKRAATLLLNTIDRKNQNIQIISSSRNPYIVGYKDIVESGGFTAEELTFNDVNLELAKKLTGITKFIVIDDSYGYNAISVAPFAVTDNWYVLFADSRKIASVDSLLSGRKVDKMIIYGNVDRAVLSRLSKYNPEIINKEGDRFENNIEIVKKYMAVKNTKQVIITNGEFIEREIMSGTEPVLFIGSNNVPTVVQNYIKSSDISVGVLIGNELVGTATFIRRQLGLSVFVKFAQSARAPQGAISQVEGLDLFYLPKYSLNINVFKILYNRATGEIELTYTNTEDLAAYLKGTITLTDQNGKTARVGDVDAVFIDGNEYKTVTYELEEPLEGTITADIYTIFGESKKALEKVLEKTITIETVEIMDNSLLNITDLMYDKRTAAFYVLVKNTGDISVFVDLELTDVIINGIPETLGLKEVAELKPGESRWLKVDASLSDEDIAENRYVTVKAYFGERKESLIKFTTKTFELRLKGFDYVYYATTYGMTIVILILVIFIIIAFFKRRRRKKEEGYYNY